MIISKYNARDTHGLELYRLCFILLLFLPTLKNILSLLTQIGSKLHSVI